MVLPVFTQFHVAIGWTSVALASIALALKLPDLCRIPLPKSIQTLAQWHALFGSGYVGCAIFMPITANWIWPRLGTPTMVIWFIVIMFVTMVCGIVCIRWYKYLNRMRNAMEVLRSEEPAQSSLEFMADNVEQGEVAKAPLSAAKKYIWLKYLHAGLMICSYAMIVGAGAAFSSNARTAGFPYPQSGTLTDSLIGRCYGRNLTNPDAPSWLTALDCGLGAYCKESTTGGDNVYSTQSFPLVH